MIYKLTFKSIKANLSDYYVYLITLTISISLFYVIISLPESSVIIQLPPDMRNQLIQTFSIINILAILSMIVLIIYTNKYLLKRRYNEFYIYFSLGMSNTKISTLILIQYLLITTISLLFGLLFGILISQGFQYYLANIFAIDPSLVKFYISYADIILSTLVFIIISIIVGIISSIKIYTSNPLELLEKSSLYYIIKNKSLKYNLIILLSSAILFLFLTFITISSLKNYKILLNMVWVIPIYILIIYLIFYSLPTIALNILIKYSKLYYKDLNIFSIKQLILKLNNNWVILGTISLMLFLSFIFLSTGFFLSSYHSNFQLYTTPNDLEFNSVNDIDINPIKQKIIMDGFKNIIIVKVPVYNTNLSMGSFLKKNKLGMEYSNTGSSYDLNAIPLTKYNELLSINDLSTINLKSNEFSLCINPNYLTAEKMELINNYTTLSYNNTIMTLHNNKIEKHILSSNVRFSINGFLVFPDDIIKNTIPITYTYLIQLNDVYSREYIDEITDYITKIDSSTLHTFSSKRYEIDETQINSLISIVLIFYLGATLMLISTSLLTLQICIDATDNKNNYETLLKIGTEKSIVKKSILYQILLYFSLPLMIALINYIPGSLYAFKFINYITSESIGYRALLILPFSLIFYFSFVLFTYNFYKKIINLY